MMRPLWQQVLVRLDPEETLSSGGIVIPSPEVPDMGTVLAVGRGRELASGQVMPPEVKVGDRVLLTRWGLTEVIVDGQPAVVMMESDILGVVT